MSIMTSQIVKFVCSANTQKSKYYEKFNIHKWL